MSFQGALAELVHVFERAGLGVFRGVIVDVRRLFLIRSRLSPLALRIPLFPSPSTRIPRLFLIRSRRYPLALRIPLKVTKGAIVTRLLVAVDTRLRCSMLWPCVGAARVSTVRFRGDVPHELVHRADHLQLGATGEDWQRYIERVCRCGLQRLKRRRRLQPRRPQSANR